jgi:DnaJ homolog subfamily A member 5
LKGLDPEKAKEEDLDYITPKDLINFVMPSCFNGFADEKNNFYFVYRELFKRIDKEEEQEEQVGKDHNDSPTFGDSFTYIEDVLEFYKFWEVFGTLKEFSYVDKHNINQANNARERRFIINENKKERQAEKKVRKQEILN